jgi:hypothetical protein
MRTALAVQTKKTVRPKTRALRYSLYSSFSSSIVSVVNNREKAMRKKLALLIVCGCLGASVSKAQSAYPTQDIPSRAVGFTAVAMDFYFDGSAPSEVAFAFDGMAYGLFYNREPLSLTYVRGAQDIGANDRLVLTDFALSGWMPVRPFGMGGGKRIDVFLPFGIESDYRRIRRTQNNVEIDAFEYTVVAAGGGFGLSMPLVKGVFDARGLAYYGIATRSFGNNTDASAILDIEADWSSSRITNRFGIQIGYGYRWQKWYSDIGEITGSSFDFVGKHHALRLGLTF